MNQASTSKDLLSTDLAVVHDLRQRARERLFSSYYQLEQSIQRGEEIATTVSSSLEQLNGSSQISALPQDVFSQLISARKLLLTIDMASGGESTVARLEVLLQLPNPERALKLAADSIQTAQTITELKIDADKILTTLKQWEMNQSGCIVPLILSLDDWCARLCADIPPITPGPLLTETTKILSLHIQVLAQQIDKAFYAFHTSYANIQSLSIIRCVDSDILLLDIYDHSIQHILNKAASTLTSSINAILDSITKEQESSADYLLLIANLVARFINIIEHHDSHVQQLTGMSAEPAIAKYITLHERICSSYKSIEIDQTSSILTTLLLDREPEQFEDSVEYAFQRIQRLERVHKEVIHSLESSIVQQTLSRLTTQNSSGPELLTLYLLTTFVSKYGHDHQLKEQVTKTYQAALNTFASTFISRVQSELLVITQTQDPTLFIESLCSMLEQQGYSLNYTSELASAVIKQGTMMLANILTQNPISLNQLQCLKQAFKEIAVSLRHTLKLPATQICAPLLSLQGIVAAANPEEAAMIAKGTCLETISLKLVQAHLSATPNK
ncbi:Hypothetical protein GLP15_4246 [Giardia lamblia P15]|uniref:Uncharacterized protein n=1 Tax=Giardia intestinalis (strain P15) TaxID=658858 RepID=E1EY00_GIAIA|nr:Hypothetical protein GLP15_4246 [Giardia lamblia P15]